MSKSKRRMYTLEIVIGNNPYYYEAHSHQRCAEILHSQIETLKQIHELHPTTELKTIDSFTIHYLNEVN